MSGQHTIPGNETAAALLGDAGFGPWLDTLQRVGQPAMPVTLPAGTAAVQVVEYFGVPKDERDRVLAAREWIAGDPALTWVLERSVELLRQYMERLDDPGPFPALPPDLGEPARFFYPWVFASILPDTLAATRARGIPDGIVHATFSDVGRHFLIHRAQHGSGGMSGQDWLMLHARGLIYQLGRLQFERGRLGGRTSAGIREAGFDAVKGEPCIAVHIPGFMGPFSPEACDESFALAQDFFERHFPEESYRYTVCHSWLLDQQLGEYLPTTSNIMAFQRRFRLAYTPDAADRITLEFVFRTPDRPLNELPQNTTLERAVVYHLQNGRHWHGGAGWLPFASTGKDSAR
jgi:hypothetical protein